MNAQCYVYIMTNKPFGTLYVGFCTDLIRRSWQHREGLADGFTKQYRLRMLVYYETYESVIDAMLREKQIKRWYREWKLRVITQKNPEWEDLYPQIARG